MTQFATALPKDLDGQKTTSVPMGTGTIEWTTPVQLTAGTASVGTVILGTGSATVGTVILGTGTASVGKVTKTAGSLDSNLLTSAARTASAQTTTTAVGAYTMGVFYLDVTAVSGTTPTLNVTIEGKDPTSGKYFTIGTFTQLTAIGNQRITIPQLLDSNIRVNYQIGGTTPSFTFTVGATFKA